MKVDCRAREAGTADGAASPSRSAAQKPSGVLAAAAKARHAASTSAAEVVSSHARVSSPSERRRKLTPSAAPAAITASTDVPAGGATRIVSKKASSPAVQPRRSRPARSSAAEDWQCEAISLRPSGPWYMP